jgi:endonuclease YncB( thermonuclease family)
MKLSFQLSKVVCFLCLIPFLPAYAADLTGEARIVDGDTIWIGKTKIRLHGIDAPEMRQECHQQDGNAYLCGVASTDALRILIGSGSVRCEGNTYDRYKRLIAVCYSDIANLNAELVRQGRALAYRRYSMDYVLVENEARDNKRGMWVGEFDSPWKWRRMQ